MTARVDPGPSFPVNTGERAPPSVPEQRGSPLLSSLLPLHRVPSPCSVIKTTGGIRNTAWLLPACNRHHLVHRRGFLFISFPAPSKQTGVKTSKARIFDRTAAGSRARGNKIHCLMNLSATQSVKWECEPEDVSHWVSYLPLLWGSFVITSTPFCCYHVPLKCRPANLFGSTLPGLPRC